MIGDIFFYLKEASIDFRQQISTNLNIEFERKKKLDKN